MPALDPARISTWCCQALLATPRQRRNSDRIVEHAVSLIHVQHRNLAAACKAPWLRRPHGVANDRVPAWSKRGAFNATACPRRKASPGIEVWPRSATDDWQDRRCGSPSSPLPVLPSI